jgi:transposase
VKWFVKLRILRVESLFSNEACSLIMNPTPSDWREAHRFRAFELKQDGWKQTNIAEALGVSEGAVSQWMKKAREGGKEVLKTSPRPGRPPKLSDEERTEKLPSLLEKGPSTSGFGERSGPGSESERSSRRNLASSTTSLRSVGSWIKSGGADKSPTTGLISAMRKPPKSGRTRNGRESKKAETENRTVMFVDEAGFYQLPAAVRTYAPRGETPVLRAPLDYDNLSAISGITQAGKLYMRIFEKSISGEEVVQFLRHVLREVSGKLTVVWDGLPAHWGSKVQAFLSEGASRRLHLEQLPGYTPDLNPDEGVWNYLKNVEMKNLCCRGIDRPKTELRRAKERLRHKTQIIKSFYREVGLV